MKSLMLVAVLAAAWGQSPPAFEVVSIKPAVHGPPRIRSDPGRLIVEYQAADTLIRVAYGLREYQYQGPLWLHTARYDIEAVTPSPQPRSMQLIMLQTLLTDRFKLKSHHESKTIVVYSLVTAKGGPKLKPMDANLPEPFELYSNFSMASVGERTELRGYGSLGQFADFLSRVAERPVIDRTGINGSFDLRLLCAIDGFPGYDTSPTVFEALQSQMGLKLEPATATLETTVIDHAEKPTAN